jgi:hypothetical protein
MNNTAALFNKFFTSSLHNPASNSKQVMFEGQHPNIAIHVEEDTNSQQQAVYSTRIPQKKNFSSPDDL